MASGRSLRFAFVMTASAMTLLGLVPPVQGQGQSQSHTADSVHDPSYPGTTQ